MGTVTTLPRREGWLNKYLRYTHENEAPEIYHLWCGLTIFGHILARRCFLPRGYFTTFPGQMITFLVGPSGARKSTAVNIATTLLAEVPDINLIANKLSTQSLIDSLQRGMVVDGSGMARPSDSIGFIAAPELSVLLPKQSYVEEIVPVITDLFDAKSGSWKYKTRGAGQVELTNPLVTILAASTPDWLQTNIPQNAYGGGFMPRIFNVWHPKATKIIARPEKNPSLSRLRDELLAELLWVQANVSGAFTFSPEGEKWYDRFYSAWHGQSDIGLNDFEQGYQNRRPEHLLRVAMVMAVSQKRHLILDPDALGAAHAAMEMIELTMAKCFSAIGKQTFLSQHSQLVFEFVRERGPQTRRQIQRGLWRHLSSPEIGNAIQSLMDSDLLLEFDRGTTKEYQVPVVVSPPKARP